MSLIAFRVSWQAIAGFGGAALAALAAALVVASGGVIATCALMALALAGIAVLLFGRAVFPLALIVLVPLVPVAGNPPVSSASTFRLGLMAVLLSGGFLMYMGSGEQRYSAPIRALTVALLFLAAIGIVIAVADGSSPQDTLKIISLTAGQPIAYAGFLGLFSLAIQTTENDRNRLLTAWAVVVIAEGIYVAAEFASGSAFDALRGYTRGEGTTGADFLGAFSAISLFGAMALRTTATSRRTRVLAWTAMCTAVGCVLASISRGSLIGLSVGLAYVLLRGRSRSGAESRRPLALVLALTAIVAGGLYVTKGLWQSRLASPSVGATSGRSATWVSGLLIARDHPLTGVGPDHLVKVIQGDSRYSDTVYGRTTSVPHNMWIFALAAGGLLYGCAVIWVTLRFFTVVRRSASRRSSREALYLEGALVATMPILAINNIFTHPENMVVVTLAIALLLVPRTTRVGGRVTATGQRGTTSWSRSSADPLLAGPSWTTANP
jgi:O-antigen ligase